MPAISVAFNLPGAGFVLLPAGAKAPPLRTGWQNGAWSFTEAECHEGNIGIVAGNGLIGLDQDDMAAFKEIEIPLTMDWETRPGRMAQLFVCDDVAATLAARKIRFDQAQFFLFRNGEHVGELKLQRAYQVIPPSWKTLEDGTKAEYRLIHETPPAAISLKWLLEELERIGISISESKDPAVQKLRDLEKSACRRRAETDDQRARRYALKALEEEASKVRSATEGERNNQLFKSAAALGELVGTGLLSESEVVRELTSVAEDDEPEKIPRTIQSGLVTGRRKPRELPESTRTVAAEDQQAVSPEIWQKVLAIASRGDPVKYLIWQAQRNHIGDIDYQKVLICSIASAASLTSNGIQPGSTGDKGSGKSDACAATYHLVPKDRRLDGSLSPMSLFYLQEAGRLQTGLILFSDDVEYEPIIPIYKRSTARFQQGITHYTVSGGKSRTALELKIPARLVWWLTSVESVANEQAFDRQYPVSTDPSPTHKKQVAREIAARRSRKEQRFAEDEGIAIARSIISDIFDNGPFRVVIPQADRAEWLKVADFRGQEQFWDLVDALVILRWRQHQSDADGWLIAEDRDLIEAKEIMMAHKVAHYSDLTESEVAVVGALMDGLPHTQKDLTERLGIAQSTLSERLKAIMAKSAIVTEDNERGRKLYSINPRVDLNADFWSNLDLIKLNIDSSKTYRRLSYCYRRLIGIPIGISINNSNRIPDSLSDKIPVCIIYSSGREEKKSSDSILSPIRPITEPNQQHEPQKAIDKAPITTPITLSGEGDKPICCGPSTEPPSPDDLASEQVRRGSGPPAGLRDGTEPLGSELQCFKDTNSRFFMAARDLKEFTAPTLANKVAAENPGVALTFLQKARTLGLARIIGQSADRLDLWQWLEGEQVIK